MIHQNTSSRFADIERVVCGSRWFNAQAMAVMDAFGYQPGLRFGLRESHLTPGYSTWMFYHDLAHALYAVECGEHWRLQERDFKLRYTTCITVLGEDYYEPQTTQAIDMEIRVMALQARLIQMESESEAFDVKAWAEPSVRLMHMMDDFFLLKCHMTEPGKPLATNEDVFALLLDRIETIFHEYTPERTSHLWQAATTQMKPKHETGNLQYA